MPQVYAFIDNSFLFVEGYKHVQMVANLPSDRKPMVDYRNLREFIAEAGDIRSITLCGSQLAGNIITACQTAGIDVFTLPRYPDFRTGTRREKGVDLKVAWEVAKTIFLSREPAHDKLLILLSGDKDFMGILPDIHTCGWAFQLWVWSQSCSEAFARQARVFGKVRVLDNEWKKFIKIIHKNTKR